MEALRVRERVTDLDDATLRAIWDTIPSGPITPETARGLAERAVWELMGMWIAGEFEPVEVSGEAID